MLPLPHRSILRERVPRLLAALVVVGVGIALTVAAGLGLSPWDVFHQGISRRTGLPIGLAGILVGLAVMVLWIPLGVRIGVGTVLNVVTIGLTIDATLAVLPDIGGAVARWSALAAGTVLIGLGAGAYIGVGLGTGPRDGVMTGLAARGWSVRLVRTAMELAVLVAGFALGGTIGVGTVLVAVTIGPLIQQSLAWFSLPALEPAGAIER